ncbi:MAG: methyltransferase domain-containing protein, partial [Pseudomonadota bacterium]
IGRALLNLTLVENAVPHNLDTYYQDHWVDIEPERMNRYEAMFQWREGHEVLVAGAGVSTGHRVVDYGCGPGALTIEMARRVGAGGQVIGLDINTTFLEKTQTAADKAGFGDRVDTRLVEVDQLPVDNDSVDRVLCKNVLEYVPDPGITIAEFHRILQPGGISHVSDSDWGAVIFDPGDDLFARIMQAAQIAFRTPHIGRKLYGLFHQAGFKDIKVQMLGNPDTVGALKPVLTNMASYARLSGTLPDAEIDEFLQLLERSIEDGSYFAVLPQFIVTAIAT